MDCFDKTKGWISSDKVSCKRAMFIIALEMPTSASSALNAILIAHGSLDYLPPRIQEVIDTPCCILSAKHLAPYEQELKVNITIPLLEDPADKFSANSQGMARRLLYIAPL